MVAVVLLGGVGEDLVEALGDGECVVAEFYCLYMSMLVGGILERIQGTLHMFPDILSSIVRDAMYCAVVAIRKNDRGASAIPTSSPASAARL